MTPDDMHWLEFFFYKWRYTSVAFFSFIGFVVAVTRIIGFIAKWHAKVVAKGVSDALLHQRHENQADVLDEFLTVIREQQKDIDHIERLQRMEQ